MVKTVIINPLLYLRKIILTLDCISKINSSRKDGSLIKKKYVVNAIISLWLLHLNVLAVRMDMFINPINKIYLGTVVNFTLFHTTFFISCNNNLLKEKLYRRYHNVFKLSVIKLYILWLLGDRNMNIEQHFPDVKKLPFMKEINSKQFPHVSWIFQPYKGRDNSYTLPHSSFKTQCSLNGRSNQPTSRLHTSHGLFAILKGYNGDHSEVSELFQE